MLCEKCQKKEATVFYSEVKGKQRQQHCFCESCANTISPIIEKPDVEDSLKKILSDFLDIFLFQLSSIEKQNEKCSFCGMTFQEFQKHPRLGCANDYEVFKKYIESMLETMNSSTRHIGKKAKQFLQKKENTENIEKFKSKLKIAIAEERYEDAAVLRDQIAQLERQIDGTL